MTEFCLRADIASGMWKFNDTVSWQDLRSLAIEWKTGEEGEKYLDLYIRQCSTDQRGIGFRYLKDSDSKTDHQKFFHKMTDQLKRRFGNDFVGWDVSSRTDVLV